jgi:7,8-dihydropterin-6-yl-methyl-4-(beta-D-ribofuranosyl)aminobenzene 5'-phosphate synthase
MAQGPIPDGVTSLDELEILVVVDNETDTLSSIEEGVPQVPEVVHLAAGTPPSRRYDGHDCKVVFDQLCCACHGLSVLITGRRGGQQRRMLFDIGPYPDIWLDNARRLAIDLSRRSNASSCRIGISITAARFRTWSRRSARRAPRRAWAGRSSTCIRTGRA